MARSATKAERKTIPSNVETTLIDEGLNVYFNPMFYNKEEAWVILQQLEEEIVYDKPEDSTVLLRGRRQQIRRQHVAHGDDGVVYTFSDRTLATRPWTPLLARVRDDVEKVTGVRYNFVLLNRYKDGLDRIGAHMDDESEIDPKASIVGISFGTPRDFLLRHHTLQCPRKPAETEKPKFGLYTIKLPSGSLVEMKYPTNRFWYHEIPARGRAGDNPRVSLTFRLIKQHTVDNNPQ